MNSGLAPSMTPVPRHPSLLPATLSPCLTILHKSSFSTKANKKPKTSQLAYDMASTKEHLTISPQPPPTPPPHPTPLTPVTLPTSAQ